MVGCNNDTDFVESNYFLFLDKSMKTYLRHLDALLSHLRSYKLFRTCLINLRNKIRIKRKFEPTFSKVDNGLFKTERRPETVNAPERIEEAKKHLELARQYEYRRDISLAIAECKKSIEINPYDDGAYAFLGLIYVHRCPDLGGEAYSLAIGVFKKAIEINPLNYQAHENLFNAYYRAGKKELAMKELEIMQNDSNSNNQTASRPLTYGLPDYKDSGIFNKMLSYDLENIIAMTGARRIELILQSYPNLNNWVNEVLKQAARVNQLLFIDNAAVFKEIESAKEYNKNDFYAEDGHCNANGYRVIAQNVC